MAIIYALCAIATFAIGRAIDHFIDKKHAAFRARNKEYLE